MNGDGAPGIEEGRSQVVVGQDHGAWQRDSGASRVARRVAGLSVGVRPGLNGTPGRVPTAPQAPEQAPEQAAEPAPAPRIPRARRLTDGYIGWGFFGIAWALWILAVRVAISVDSWAALLYALPAMLVTVCAVGILVEMWRTRRARSERGRRAQKERHERES